MRIEMDTFLPANSKVHLTPQEVANAAKHLKDSDRFVILRYMAGDYKTPVAEYGGQNRVVGGILQPINHRVIRMS